jgi:hypothetical protein
MERNQQFAGIEPGLVQAKEECVRRHATMAIGTRDLDFGSHGEHHRREFGCWIRQRHAAPERALIADCGVSDMRRRLAKKRGMPGDKRVCQRFDMACQRADAQPAGVEFDATQFVDMSDID